MAPAVMTTFQTNLQIHENKKNTISHAGAVKESNEIYLSMEVFKTGDILEIIPSNVESPD